MGILDKHSKLSSLVSRLRDLEAECLRLGTADLPVDQHQTKKLYEDRLNQLENSHSHSWFGDHSDTYFDGFQPVPPGQSFDVEWGFIPGFHGARNRGWRIYSRDEIKGFLFHDIGEDIFYQLKSFGDQLATEFSNVRDQALDVTEVLSKQANSKALSRYTERMENELGPYKPLDFINSRIKSAPRMTRDSEEIAKGQKSRRTYNFWHHFRQSAQTRLGFSNSQEFCEMSLRPLHCMSLSQAALPRAIEYSLVTESLNCGES